MSILIKRHQQDPLNYEGQTTLANFKLFLASNNIPAEQLYWKHCSFTNIVGQEQWNAMIAMNGNKKPVTLKLKKNQSEKQKHEHGHRGHGWHRGHGNKPHWESKHFQQGQPGTTQNGEVQALQDQNENGWKRGCRGGKRHFKRDQSNHKKHSGSSSSSSSRSKSHSHQKKNKGGRKQRLLGEIFVGYNIDVCNLISQNRDARIWELVRIGVMSVMPVQQSKIATMPIISTISNVVKEEVVPVNPVSNSQTQKGKILREMRGRFGDSGTAEYFKFINKHIDDEVDLIELWSSLHIQ